ncbi:MAG TPA: hypothetical protein VK623_10800 [Flavobacterium sp.]|nr:hypothetical protein [Flavobacterium sp.]
MKKILLLSILTFVMQDATAQISSFKIFNKTRLPNADTGKIKNKGVDEKVFITLEIVQWNYLEQEKKTKTTELDNLKKELYKNSDGTDGGPIFSQATRDTKGSRVKVLRTEISDIEVQQDSLYKIYASDYINYQNYNFLNFGKYRSSAFFNMLYGNGNKFKTLGNAGVSFGNNTGSIFSEIVNGNLGIVRVSLGTMVSNSESENPEEEQNEEAYQRLVNYGGNTVLNFEYPIMYFHSRNSQYNLISRLMAKGTADFPAFGTKTEEWAGSGVFGVDLYGDASVSNNSLRFFFNCNINKIYGTDIFKENLGIPHNDFSFGQLTLGLVFLENFKISFTVATFSSEESLTNRNVIAGGQVLK